MDMMDMVVGKEYRFKYSGTRLVYIGYNWSGNGYWHQFALITSPDKVWSEISSSDLGMIVNEG